MCTVHVVVRSDPDSERKYLFVNQAWTAQVIGLAEQASDDLLGELHQYFYTDDNVYEHHWAEGDMVLWYNLAVQHSRGRAGTGVSLSNRELMVAQSQG